MSKSNLAAAVLFGAFSAASFTGNLGCYDNGPACTTHIVNKLAKERTSEGLTEKTEASVKQALESGDQVTFDAESNVTITQADVEAELEKSKTSAQRAGTIAAAFSLLYFGAARRKKEEDGSDGSKGGNNEDGPNGARAKQFWDNHLG
jgi:hypothetical protein